MRGGARKGAGRHKSSDKTVLSLYVRLQTKRKIIRMADEKGCSRGEVIDELLSPSKK